VRDDFTCPNCGHIQEKGDSCSRCGVFYAKFAARAERDFHTFHDHLPGGAACPVMSEEHERLWAMSCHLMVLSGFLIPFGNVLGPLAVWLWKRKQSEFIDYHGKTALNYQITLLLFLVGCTVVIAISGFVIGFVAPVFGILAIYTLVMIVVSAVKAHRGDYAEIPLSAAFIR
jgi:uncharacterized Tic20 family protein